MADNSLSLVSESEVASVLTPGDIDTINSEIDKYIAAHKDTRHEINRLVFDSVANITEAEEAGRKLASKGFFGRLIGGVTGSNAALQNKINSSRAAAQYAAQQTLQKLAEQNVMTFDMIAAVNNKLNQSMLLVGEEFKRVYAGLAAFLNKNRSEMARMEARLQRVERNVNILNWQSTIEYLEWDGVPYNDLDNTSKIVCVARDFYEITKGEWTLSDLLLLKSAMSMVGIDVKGTLNYFDTLLEIAETPRLKEKLLGGGELKAIEDPSYVVFMGGMKKLEMLAGDEKYIVDTIAACIDSDGQNKDDIRAKLTDKYLANQAGVNANTSIETYDFVLELLYNLKQAADEDILSAATSQATDPAYDIYIEALNYECVDEDLHKAFEHYQKAAEMGNADATYKLGEYYYYGKGVEQGYEKAVEWYRKGAELGNKDALASLANCYLCGYGVDEDEPRALSMFKEAAELGSIWAVSRVGDCYYSGWGTEKNRGKAIEWYSKSAEDEHGWSMYRLGICYDKGWGVDNDKTKAADWYKRAAEHGIQGAMRPIARCYEDGQGIEKNEEKAFEWFLKAAELGDAEAMQDVSRCYWNGIGVASSHNKGVEWELKAAEHGNTFSMCQMGMLYKRGIVVEQSYEKAAEWYRKAAEVGDGWADLANNNLEELKNMI